MTVSEVAHLLAQLASRDADAEEMRRRFRVLPQIATNVAALMQYDDLTALHVADALYKKKLGYKFLKPTAGNEELRRRYAMRGFMAYMTWKVNVQPENVSDAERQRYDEYQSFFLSKRDNKNDPTA